ncbi:hypothetical protein BH23PLA1_BH23PLA1_08190 [soil metagenome]
MMTPDAYLLVFAIAFMGCVLFTPLVTRIAVWTGAIDCPDQFRRIHKGATPRLGGLALAFGLALSFSPMAIGGALAGLPAQGDWWTRQMAVVVAAAIVLIVGVVDDTRGMSPRTKLLGQMTAVIALILGGIRIQSVEMLGMELVLSYPISLDRLGLPLVLDLPSAFFTMLWFLGCMNVWNLIDGMDGLASGVGLLVSATLMLVAFYLQNYGAALMAAALAGALAGFLLYNWHPACIFLGDCGSLLIGLLLGVIGIEGSLKGTTTISILLPILAMGLPISDTAMAIFRRWVRNLPLSSADRRHVHHLLIGLGLNPRQAAGLLYCFTAFLCGVVLLGVAARSEILILMLGISGCLAFLLILYSRRDELTSLRSDLMARFSRGSQERQASKATWEAIQRIELCEDPDKILDLVEEATRSLGCDAMDLACHRRGKTVLHRQSSTGQEVVARPEADRNDRLSAPTATFRLTGGDDLVLVVSLHQASGSNFAADIAFRFLQRLSLATAERLSRLLGEAPVVRPEVIAPADVRELKSLQTESHPMPSPVVAFAPQGSGSGSGRGSGTWWRWALGWNVEGAPPIRRHPWSGRDSE